MPETKHAESDTRELLKSLISEVLAPVLKQNAEALQSVAMTPEKIEAMKKPYVDPNYIAQMRRTQSKERLEGEELAKALKAWQDSCSHKYSKGVFAGSLAIQVVHNYPDMKPRGWCKICAKKFEPAHYDYRPDGSPHGKQIIVPADPQYNLVLEADQVS